jgi:hypothetical protein
MFSGDRCQGPARPAWRLTLCVAAALLARPAARAADAFDDLNEAFRQNHAAAREREWSRRGPVILVEFDRLTLFTGGDRRTAEVIPPAYHRLKSVAHAPLAAYLALEGSADGPLDDGRQTQLKDLAARARAARAALDAAGFGPEALGRQRDILDRTAKFVADTLETGSAGPDALRAFASEVRPLIAKNIDEAAALQILAYDRQVAAWQRAFPGVDWGSLKVVITGSALPRKGNLATRYFARLLGVPGEGPRLVYAEGLFEEAKALRLLSATAVDGKAARVFFDDPTRLYRDLMAEAAVKFLSDRGAELEANPGGGRP